MYKRVWSYDAKVKPRAIMALDQTITTKLDHFWNSIDGKKVLANK